MIFWFVAVAVVATLGGVAALAAGLGGALGDVERLPGQVLPERDLTPQDLRHARFPTVLRGYRPDDVDALLDRVAQEWQARLDAVSEPAATGVDGSVRGPRGVDGEAGSTV